MTEKKIYLFDAKLNREDELVCKVVENGGLLVQVGVENRDFVAYFGEVKIVAPILDKLVREIDKYKAKNGDDYVVEGFLRNLEGQGVVLQDSEAVRNTTFGIVRKQTLDFN